MSTDTPNDAIVESEEKTPLLKLREKCAWMNRFDPFYWFVWIIHLPFLLSRTERSDRLFIMDNISKHRFCWWATMVSLVCTIMDPSDDIKALEIQAYAMTTAWFIITFAAIPQKYIHVSMYITGCMFTAFWSAYVSMGAISIMEAGSCWVVIKILKNLLCGYIAAVLYDTADGLKAGLDDWLLKSSRAALMWHRQEHDIDPDAPK